ncbi:MAG: hypothetical protein IPK68_23200 [Bdellovibrionales bacterium]|nr:hypothetical protein [Bdellovibrionales bacterium]
MQETFYFLSLLFEQTAQGQFECFLAGFADPIAKRNVPIEVGRERGVINALIGSCRTRSSFE